MGKRSDTGAKGAALLIATLSSFLTPFMISSINIALPSIGGEFSLDAVTLGWVATSYQLTAAMFLLPFGRLADICGRKRVFTYGVILFTLTSLLSGFSISAAMLIAIRAVQGIGGAMIFGTGVAILTSVFPAGERGRALGINVATVYLGLSLGPPIGGFLTQNLGWRSMFFLSVPLGLVILGAVYLRLKQEWAGSRGERFDLPGSVIYSLALVALIYGFSLLPSVSGAWLIAAGTVGLLVFIWWENRTPSPILELSLFRHNTVFAFSNLAALVNYSATWAAGFLLSLYLQYIKGFNPGYAGLILMAQPVVMSAISPLAGRLSDRIEPRFVASAGMTLSALGLVMLIFLSQNTTLPYILLSLFILGLGFGLFSSPNTNALMSSVETKYYGIAASTLGTMRVTGQMLSMAMAMLLFALYMGRVQITPEYYPLFLDSVRTAFLISALLCFGGIFASLARGKVR